MAVPWRRGGRWQEGLWPLGHNTSEADAFVGETPSALVNVPGQFFGMSSVALSGNSMMTNTIKGQFQVLDGGILRGEALANSIWLYHSRILKLSIIVIPKLYGQLYLILLRHCRSTGTMDMLSESP